MERLAHRVPPVTLGSLHICLLSLSHDSNTGDICCPESPYLAALLSETPTGGFLLRVCKPHHALGTTTKSMADVSPPTSSRC